MRTRYTHASGPVHPGQERPGDSRPGEARPEDLRPGKGRPEDLRLGEFCPAELRRRGLRPGLRDRRSRDGREAALELPTLLVWLLLPAVYLFCAFAFITDVTTDNTLAYGIAYVPAICTAVVYRHASMVWWLAAGAILLVAIGYFFPAVNSAYVVSIGNRLLSVAAILVTAALVRYSRHIQEQLARQTARAEAAEQVKTEIFANLSQEIRTPLHSIIGFAELMVANCRPDQKVPLAQMQVGGKRLLATIDNLIDITTLEARPLEAAPVELGPMLRELIAAAEGWAVEREVALSLQEPVSITVRTDPWAIRRILENLVSNAVKFTQGGGTVVLRLRQEGPRAVIEVDDSGVGLSLRLQRVLQAPDAAPGAGTGVTLCHQLAAAIGAQLTFESSPGCGTVVRLSLPL